MGLHQMTREREHEHTGTGTGTGLAPGPYTGPVLGDTQIDSGLVGVDAGETATIRAQHPLPARRSRAEAPHLVVPETDGAVEKDPTAGEGHGVHARVRDRDVGAIDRGNGFFAARDNRGTSDSPSDRATVSPVSTGNDCDDCIVGFRGSAENPLFNALLNTVKSIIYPVNTWLTKMSKRHRIPVSMHRDRISWVAKRLVGFQREGVLSLDRRMTSPPGNSRSRAGECHG